MNAYKLADEAKNIHNTIEALEFVQKAVPMLRQQANRIAELEKELKRIKFAWNLAENEIESLAPQTKPLSDADIQQISHRYHYTYNPDYVGFARAIEERHGIK